MACHVRLLLVVCGATSLTLACGSSSKKPPDGSADAAGNDGAGNDAAGNDAPAGDLGLDTPGAEAPDDTPPPPFSCTPVSGTRLRLKYMVSGEAKVFWAMQDMDRDEECVFAMADDAKLRCLPRAEFGPISYLDVDCSMPVAAIDLAGCPGRTIPHYYGASLEDDCVPRTEVFEVGEKLATPTAIYRRSGPDCLASAVPPGDFYPLASLAADDFALATVVPSTGASRIVVDTLMTADGAGACATDFRDKERNEVCEFGRAADEMMRCLPQAHSANFYANAACTMSRVGVAAGKLSCHPYASTSVNPNACNLAKKIFALGDSMPDGYFRDAAQMCKPGSPDLEYSDLGAEVDPTSFVLGSAPGVGLGRIQTVDRRTADGLRADQAFQYDTVRKELCTFTQTKDGKLRCIPGDVATSLFYSDPACTQLLPLASVATGCTSATYPGPTTLARDSGACMGARLYRLGAVYSGKTHQKVNGACSEVVSVGVTYYRLGAEVEPAEFAEGTVVIE